MTNLPILSITVCYKTFAIQLNSLKNKCMRESGNAKRVILLLICTIAFTVNKNAFAQKSNISKEKKVSEATGLQDREYWCNILFKIAYPVIHNLAQGTLKKNMPVEEAPAYSMQSKKVTYLEAVGRTMAGIAPWLSLPDDDSKEGEMRKKLKEELLKGLSNAVDPNNTDYLDFRSEPQQLVDAAFIAHAFLRAPATLWQPLDTITKKHFITEFKSLRNRKPAYNNWLLFSAMTETFLLYVGEEYDPERIDIAVRKMQEWYVGDGWYSDSPVFSMDYYNSYVIHPMFVDILKVLVQKDLAKEEDYNQALKRMVRFAEFQERIISPEGTYPPFGRSITYRTGAFQALSQIALMEQLPQYILPAQVRCGLTKAMHNMFDSSNNFDANGWLVLGFNGHQPEVADTYTSTGSLYMATLGFLALGLPATNAFWSAPAADWTSKKAWNGQPFKKDYHVDY
jgi:hypothetical protein